MNEEFILNHFAKTKVGIFTSDEYKAEVILSEIYDRNRNDVKGFKNGREYKQLMLNDGTYYVWIRPTDSARGHKCRKAYIDKNIDIQTFEEIIVPICIFCSRNDIKVI